MSTLPRLLIGSLFLALPLFLVLILLVETGALDAVPALVSAVAGYALLTVLLWPLIAGIVSRFVVSGIYI